MTFLTTLKTVARATVVAAALGSVGLVAMPAQAAQPDFHFAFKFGNNNGGPGMKFNYNNNPKYVCLSDGQIYWQLKNAGYKSVQIVDNKKWFAIAVARWHFQWYQLLINRCSGNIQAQPVEYNGPGNGGPGFNGPGYNGPGNGPGYNGPKNNGPKNYNGFNITLSF
jgi:hypothetical protein